MNEPLTVDLALKVLQKVASGELQPQCLRINGGHEWKFGYEGHWFDQTVTAVRGAGIVLPPGIGRVLVRRKQAFSTRYRDHSGYGCFTTYYWLAPVTPKEPT